MLTKAFGKIQHPFIITYLNMIKPIYDKTTANIILNVEKLKGFPLSSVATKGCPCSPLLFNIVVKS